MLIQQPLHGGREQWWDKSFADGINFTADPIVARPDVLETGVGADDEFVVLASDGLWCGPNPNPPASRACCDSGLAPALVDFLSARAGFCQTMGQSAVPMQHLGKGLCLSV